MGEILKNSVAIERLILERAEKTSSVKLLFFRRSNTEGFDKRWIVVFTLLDERIGRGRFSGNARHHDDSRDSCAPFVNSGFAAS